VLEEENMKLRTLQVGAVLWLLGALTLLVGGCGKAEDKAGQAVDNKAHDHSGWWCDEHGVPEEICGQCNPKLAAEFKKKGDWCEEHDRPKSQCFKCDPKLKEKFAALYRAKYGKEPPPTEDEEKEKGGDSESKPNNDKR
jgi:hypothetical protein